MDRRDFVKMLGSVVPAWGLVPIANAQSAVYDGPVLINVHATGGMDASSFGDPRETDPKMNAYAARGQTAIVAGNLRTAPLANNGNFFTMYSRNMLLVNGLNSTTNDHGAGQMVQATGSLDMGWPNIAELYAFQKAGNVPLAWLASGGFNMSAGILPATAVPDANSFRTLVDPNAASATTDAMKRADMEAMFQARAARMAAVKASGKALPRQMAVADQFLLTEKGRLLMDRVAASIPATFDRFQAAHVALIAASAGITAAVELQVGDYDSHGNLDNDYATTLTRATDLLDYLMQKSVALNIGNRVIIRMYTEFSRSPFRNDGDGKDHYPVGSQLFMAPNAPWGNRVFGASGPQHQQLKVDPKTGLVDATNGIVMQPRHIHAAFRKFLGIGAVDPRFELPVPANEQLELFNPAAQGKYYSI